MKLGPKVFIAIVLVLMPASSFAAFMSVSSATITAAVSFTDRGKVDFSIEIRNVLGDDTTGQIWWDTNYITLGSTKTWYVADSYVVIHTTITRASCGIQIYTDNRAADANPYYKNPKGNPAGLIAEEAPEEDPIALCWRIVDNKTGGQDIQQGATGYPDRLWEQSLGDGYPCFLWMKDKNTPAIPSANTAAFVNGEDYVTIKESRRGIQHAESTWSGGITRSPDYVYIGANFGNATTPRSYKTSTLRFEAFTE